MGRAKVSLSRRVHPMQSNTGMELSKFHRHLALHSRRSLSTIKPLHTAMANTGDRSALAPTTTKALIAAGYQVNVERSPQRIFDDEEYEKVGASSIPENTCRDAPKDNIIIGL
jgi:hypothetical protein